MRELGFIVFIGRGGGLARRFDLRAEWEDGMREAKREEEGLEEE